MRTFPTLYAVDKNGKVLLYNKKVLKVEGFGHIEQQTGQLGGKQTHKVDIIKVGKNRGKANETTPIEQALSEAQSDWVKKQREGYKTLQWLETKAAIVGVKSTFAANEDKKAADLIRLLGIKHNTDHNDRPKPMLAEKWKSHKKKLKYPVLVQPKYNGFRCKIGVEEGRIILLSREGEVFRLPHIEDDASVLTQTFHQIKKRLLESGDIAIASTIELDGELYRHGWKLQEISHHVKTPSLLSLELQFMCYDVAAIGNMATRRELRDTLVAKCGENIVVTEEKICHNEGEVLDYFNYCTKQGYEGAIVRNLTNTYHFGFRDWSLLKLKNFFSEDFEIVGTNLKDNAKESDFVWTCKTKQGRLFDVKPFGTVEQRKEMYMNRDQYIGKMLQTSFHEWTADKIPMHFFDVVVRDYE